jgi:hypothetical protein
LKDEDFLLQSDDNGRRYRRYRILAVVAVGYGNLRWRIPQLKFNLPVITVVCFVRKASVFFTGITSPRSSSVMSPIWRTALYVRHTCFQIWKSQSRILVRPYPR